LPGKPGQRPSGTDAQIASITPALGSGTPTVSSGGQLVPGIELVGY
jgi:hypothetical protein